MSDSVETPWTISHLSMGSPSHWYCSGLPFLSPGDLPDPGIEPVSPAWAAGFFTADPLREPFNRVIFWLFLQPLHLLNLIFSFVILTSHLSFFSTVFQFFAQAFSYLETVKANLNRLVYPMKIRAYNLLPLAREVL